MSRRPALHAYTTITSTDWAMTQEYLDLFVAVALRENDPVEAVERRLGRRLDNTHEVTVRDGVATIPVLGPIFRYADVFTQISGGATVETLARDLTTALDSPDVQSILLYIDSPGGEINGVNEFADMIYAARAQKPIYAYGSYLVASGAYWLASAAERLLIDATAVVGSIGVVTAVRDPSKAPSRDIEFVSSQSPGKRVDPTTDAGRQAIQTRIDALAEVFIGAVARNRAVDPAIVADRFGRGGVLIGRDAVAVGMADALGSYESALSTLVMAARPMPLAAPYYPLGRPTDMPPVARVQEVMMPEEQKPPAPELAQAAELAALRTQLAQERMQRINAQAASFADEQIRDHRMLPGERAAWVELYGVLASDDAAHPRADGARVDLLRASFVARPPHALTTERVPSTPAQPLTVQTNRTETPTDDTQALADEAAQHARRYAERANGRGTAK